MKNNIVACLFLALASVFCTYADEKISLTQNECMDKVLAFPVLKYRADPEDIISVNVQENKVSILARKQGNCTLTLTGSGDITKKYSVTVLSNLKNTMRQLQNELQDIDLDMVDNEENIIIRGTISNPEKYREFLKTLSFYDSKKLIHNYVKFTPDTRSFENLKKMLEHLGYVISPKKEPLEPRELWLSVNDNVFQLVGKVFSDAEKEEILRLLKDFPVLAVNTVPDRNAGQIQCNANICVVSSQIVVDVAFVALSKNDSEEIGVDSLDKISSTLNLNHIYDMVAGRTAQKTATINNSLETTLQYLKGNGVSRVYQAGTVTFTNNSTQGGHLKIGGTKYIATVGSDTVVPVDYGFIVTIKGNLLTRDSINLDLSLETSFMENELEKSENILKNDRIAKLNQTLIAGGFHAMTRSITKQGGLPVLQNIPVVKWFVTQEGDNDVSSELAILLCPRICKDEDVNINLPSAENDVELEHKVSIDNEEYRKTYQKPKYSGWLTWLNWFQW